MVAIVVVVTLLQHFCNISATIHSVDYPKTLITLTPPQICFIRKSRFHPFPFVTKLFCLDDKSHIAFGDKPSLLNISQ